MDTLFEFGRALKTRRAEIGLTQSQVAELSGLSRQTVSQLETGSAPDLGINKVDKLASALGLSLRLEVNTSAPRRRAKVAPLKRAAQSGNVSYKSELTAARLKKILVHGKAPSHLEPHVHAILDDAPVSLLASLADQVHKEANLTTTQVWSNYKRLAGQVKSKRQLWK